MTVIDFYDCSATDRRHISRLFGRKKVRFCSDPIDISNVDSKATIISVFVNSNVSAEIMDLMPKLKLIAVRATGYNNVDLAAAAQRGIAVVNVPAYGDHTVAEYAFGLILSLLRKIPASMAAVENGNPPLRGHDISGKTLGVIGTGRIGQKVISIAKAFNMNVIAYDPFPNKHAARKLGFHYVTLQNLLKNSHIVTLHAPYNSNNHHLIGVKEFTLMRRGSYIINTARGELIDNQALISALENNHLAGAALDVLEGEKLISHQEEIHLLRSKELDPYSLELSFEVTTLLKMPNVIITQHNAYNSWEAIRRINLVTVENIALFLKKKPQNIVNQPSKQIGTLIVIRHGESTWNALGKWTGTTNVHLSEKGYKEALEFGRALADVPINYAYYSEQVRSLETLQNILTASNKLDTPIEESSALNERDYGDYTGLNKWDMKKEVGTKKFNNIRRNWDYPVPNGETLKMVYERTVPFYLAEVLPKLLDGQNVLLVAHGNSIRALMKYIESISDRKIAKTEMIFGEAIFYTVDTQGKMLNKQKRTIDTTPPPA